VANGSRASELEGAFLHVQLDRLPGLIAGLRKTRKRLLRETAKSGLTPTPRNDPAGECATCLFYTLPTAAKARRFAELVGCGIAGQTGRHVYTEWDPILTRQGAHHPGLNPYKLPQNKRCRTKYSKTMCKQSLDYLNRTAMIGLRPEMKAAEVRDLVKRINAAGKAVLD
jgi:dTDP-4-amino-4,6-dideoxygalactose transaminase